MLYEPSGILPGALSPPVIRLASFFNIFLFYFLIVASLWLGACGPWLLVLFLFLIEKISLLPLVGIGWQPFLGAEPGTFTQRELSIGFFHVFEFVSFAFEYKFHSSFILYEHGQFVALAAWSLRLVALAMGQDPLDAWRLELNNRTESRPVFGDDVQLQQQRGPLGHAAVTNF